MNEYQFIIDTLKTLYDFIIAIIPWMFFTIALLIFRKPLIELLSKDSKTNISNVITNKEIKIILISDKEVIADNENYILLYGTEEKKYSGQANEMGISISLKKNQIVEVNVLYDRKLVGSKKINSGISQLEFIEVAEDKPKEN